jgi:hypothetical protein
MGDDWSEQEIRGDKKENHRIEKLWCFMRILLNED